MKKKKYIPVLCTVDTVEEGRVLCGKLNPRSKWRKKKTKRRPKLKE